MTQVARDAGLDGHLDRALRTDHQGLSAVEVGGQAEQVVGAGAPAVQGEDRGKGPVSGRNVRGVEEVHGPAGYSKAADALAHGGR